MNQEALIPIILAGGKGERFWPLSRRDRPKQFLKLLPDGRSLIRTTADRVLPLVGGWDRVWVVTSFELLEGIGEHLPPLPAENLLIEPEGRDTAAAVAWAVLEINKRYGPEAVVALFPADHWIGDEPAFRSVVCSAMSLAKEKDAILTLGIQPTHAATGYGYIEMGEKVGTYGEHSGYKVQRFTEKPDLQTAEGFLAQGGFSWNGGIFIFRAGVMLGELRRHAPDILEPLESLGRSAYPTLPKRSLDYAVMEKTDKAYVIPGSFGWDDLGDWAALERLLKGDNQNLALAKHIGLDTKGAILYTTNGDDLIVTLGMDNVIVVRDGPVTLILPKSRSQEIKKVLESLKAQPEMVGLL